MADEVKPEQKSPVLEPPKDIEELLKELPKINPPKPAIPPPAMPPPKPPAPSLPPPKPQMPPPPRSAGQPGTLSVPPKPLSPPIPQTDKFKSLVRTMGEDLEAAKKGIKPESKPFEIKPPPGGPKIAPPPPPLKMPPQGPQIKLGPAERTKSLESPKLGPPAPPIGAAAPKKFNLNRRILIIVLAALIAFAGAWWFINREPEIVFTPTPTTTPIPTPLSLAELVISKSQITIPSTEDFSTVLNNKIKSLAPISNDFIILEIFDENQNIYTISDFIARLNISTAGILDSLDPSDAAILLYGQQEIFDDKGILTFNQTPKAKIALIAKSVNPASTRNSLNNWEITMTNDLKALFGINPAKATSEAFLDNIYGGADIRYRNFPYADSSIDYAIVNLPQFNQNYFVLTNSRKSIYSTIDLLQNQ